MRVEKLAENLIHRMGPMKAWESRREYLLIELGRVYAAGWRDGALYMSLLFVGLVVLAALLFASATIDA